MPTVKAGSIKVIPDHKKFGILGCINEHDGTGFLHAILLAYHPGYSMYKSEYYRTNLVKSVRIGALPEILKTRYGTDTTLSPAAAEESHRLFGQALAYGSSLPETLNRDYAAYLGVSYRLVDADISIIDEYYAPGAKTHCDIFTPTDDEYHLIVKFKSSKSEDKPNDRRFQILSSIA
jgi:hypothetical protein